MKLLFLCLALALASAHHQPGHEGYGGHGEHDHHDHHDDHDHHDHHEHHEHELDRCQGLEMDAVVVNEEGIPHFFKNDHLFKGFHGKAEWSNESFAELDDHHHLGHVDAAFRLHFEGSADHDHTYFFLDNKVFSYYQHKLEEGFPKDISEVFPGIPDHLDAAVECPHHECENDSVIFFKGHEIFHFDVKTKTVDEKEFHGMPNCTSAFRFLEQYYCFHGHHFSKFDPKTGEVHGRYPKEVRDYFVRCAKFSDDSDHVERERCSHVHLDAIASDNSGNIYAFRGHHFIRKDKDNDTLHADTIEHAFKELHSEVDAVFAFEDHLYMIKDEQVFLYKIGEPHTHVEGYPKLVKEELGIEGPIDAAFVCKDHHTAHIVKGEHIYEVDLKSSDRVASNQHSIPFKNIDTAMCSSDGVTVFVGNHFYHYDNFTAFASTRVLPRQHRVSVELFGCDH